jgi:hypothetical protein
MIHIPHKMWHILGIGKVHTGFRWRNLRERDYLHDLGIDGKIVLKLMFRGWDSGPCTGLIWLWIGTRGRTL